MIDRIKRLFTRERHQWVTLREFPSSGVIYHSNGQRTEVNILWRDQRCELTGKTRRQSNFGSGWATEDED